MAYSWNRRFPFTYRDGWTVSRTCGQKFSGISSGFMCGVMSMPMTYSYGSRHQCIFIKKWWQHTLLSGWLSATSIAQEAAPYPQSRTFPTFVTGGNISLPSKTIFRSWCWAVSRSISSCLVLSVRPRNEHDACCIRLPHLQVQDGWNCRRNIFGNLVHGLLWVASIGLQHLRCLPADLCCKYTLR